MSSEFMKEWNELLWFMESRKQSIEPTPEDYERVHNLRSLSNLPSKQHTEVVARLNNHFNQCPSPNPN
jgi:hypothetical protein